MNREQLIATLAGTAGHGWYADGDGDGRYVDWSHRRVGGGYVLEVGDANGEAVQLEMTAADLAELHRQLTLTLLADSEPETTT